MKIVKTIIYIILIFVSPLKVNAQDCTVNAGVLDSICENSFILLKGNIGGNIINGSVFWEQKTTFPAVIDSFKNIKTKVSKLSGYNTYIFRINATCKSGHKVYQDVKKIVFNIPKPSLGKDTFLCYSDHDISLKASPLKIFETGKWKSISGGISFKNQRLNETDISTKDQMICNGKIAWLVKNKFCPEQADTLNITVVNAYKEPDFNIDFIAKCIDSIPELKIKGAGCFGYQSILWEFISGPTVPKIQFNNKTITGVDNTINGKYVFKNINKGLCISDTTMVTLNVRNKKKIDIPRIKIESKPDCPPYDKSYMIISNNSTVKCIQKWEIINLDTNKVKLKSTSDTSYIIEPKSIYNYKTTFNIGFEYSFKFDSINHCKTQDYLIFKHQDSFDFHIKDTIIPCKKTSFIHTTKYFGTKKPAIVWSYIDDSIPKNITEVPNQIRISNKFITDSFYNFIQPGTYRYKVEAIGSCLFLKDTIRIKVPRTAEISNGGSGSTMICGKDTCELTGNVPKYNYGKWHFLSGGNIPDLFQTNHINCKITKLDTGVNLFVWKIYGDSSCPSNDDTVKVIVLGNNQPNAIAQNDTLICKNIHLINLNANEAPIYSKSKWLIDTTIFKSNNLINSNTILYNVNRKKGLFKVIWQLKNNCGISQDTVNVFIDSANINLPNDTIFCNNENYLLEPKGEFISNQILWNNTLKQAKIKLDTSGLYKVSYLSQCGIANDSINVEYFSKPQTIAIDKIEICNQTNPIFIDLDSLTNQKYNQYIWKNGYIGSKYTFNNTDIYRFEIVNKCGIIKDSIIVSFLKNPIILLAKDTLFCDTNKAVIKIDSLANYEYLWDHQFLNSKITISKSGIHYLQIKNKCGIDSDSIFIRFNFKPKLKLGKDSIFCDRITLNELCPKYHNQIDTFIWQNGHKDKCMQVFDSGLFILKGINACGSISDSIKLILDKTPVPKLANDTAFCFPTSFELNANVDADLYIWNNNITDQKSIIINDFGKYQLTTISKYACKSSDEIMISQKCNSKIYIPNSFSPNDDGINDVFEPVYSDLKSIEYTIYNMWGQQIYSSKNGQLKWDGTFKNGKIQMGTFMYILKYQDLKGYHLLKGTIHVIL